MINEYVLIIIGLVVYLGLVALVLSILSHFSPSAVSGITAFLIVGISITLFVGAWIAIHALIVLIGYVGFLIFVGDTSPLFLYSPNLPLIFTAGALAGFCAFIVIGICNI